MPTEMNNYGIKKTQENCERMEELCKKCKYNNQKVNFYCYYLDCHILRCSMSLELQNGDDKGNVVM